MSVRDAIAALKKGKMIVIYDADDREGEADLVISARYVKPQTIETFRKDAGGLICAAIDWEDAKKAGLEFFTDVIERSGTGMLRKMSCRKTAYGGKPAFSLPVNYKGVYTGIPDNDRALTLRKLDKVLRERPNDFCREFYTPGHIFLLIGRGLEKRKGHTELSLELAKQSRLGGVMVLCEMLGKGRSLSKKDAKNYARKHGLVFIEGKEITDAFGGRE